MDALSLVAFLPLFGAVVVALIPARAHGLIRWFSLLLTTGVFVYSLKLVQAFQANADMQMVVDAAWLPSLGVSYKIGIDGISLFLVMLVTFLTPITILGCFNSIEERVKEFFIAMLVLETAMIGAFISLDLFLFYIFWEAMLIPMYFMIGIWGGERKIYATVKFFIYTMVGSLLMLVAILYVVHAHRVQTGELTFDLALLMGTAFSSQQQWLLFLAFALAFAIKVPMFPFHTWLPDAHVEAPTPGSVILAGVLLKMGTYGFIRFAMPMFPEAAIRAIPYIAALSDHRHHLRRVCRDGAAGREEAGRVLVGVAPGLRDAGAVRAQRAGGAGCHAGHDQPRHFDGRLVLAGRRHLRATPHAPDLRVRRAHQGDAVLRHRVLDRRAVVDRAAAA